MEPFSEREENVHAVVRVLVDRIEPNRPVPALLQIRNSTESDVYLYLDRRGAFESAFHVWDARGDRVVVPMDRERGWGPLAYWPKKNGRRVFTVPVKRVKPQEKIEIKIRDALRRHRPYLGEGTYTLQLADVTLVCKVGSVYTHKIGSQMYHWIDPTTIAQRRKCKGTKVQFRVSEDADGKKMLLFLREESNTEAANLRRQNP